MADLVLADKHGVVKLILPWALLVSMLGLFGWREVGGDRDRPSPTDLQLRADMSNLQTAVAADRATSTAQFGEILRRLDRIEGAVAKM